MVRRLLLGILGGVALTLASAATDSSAYQRVAVASTKTSIYIGTVSMSMPTFVRHGGTYSAAYAATVFPFFFENEKGTLTVDVSDDQLQQLAAGKTIEFTGRGVRDDGTIRRVEAKATPQNAEAGTLKVKVYISKRIVLVFNTTYRFEPAAK